MAAIGKWQVEMPVFLGKLFDHFGAEVGCRHQRRHDRREIAPLAIDFNAECQFEPIDAARFELCIDVVRWHREMVGKIIINADFKPFRLQFRHMKIDEIEPVMRLGHCQGHGHG